MRPSRALWATCIFLLGCASNAEDEIPEVTFRGASTIDEYLNAYIEAPGGPPSISLAVSVDGEMVLTAAAGYADLENRIAATPSTAYRAYSISKGLTATAVLQALERGELTLEDDIRASVPAFPEKRWPVRLRDLLTHTSGIRHYKPDAGEISSTVEYSSLADSLVVFGEDPLGFEPGTGYGYTSFGFNLLTGAVEAATGASFEAALDRHIFGPAGMERSSLAVAGRETEGLAKAYWAPRFGRHREIDELPNVSGKYGSSGVVSTPSDLVRFFIALDRGDLMKPETLAQMIDVPDPAVADGQALGWNTVVENGKGRLSNGRGHRLHRHRRVLS